MAVTGIAGVAVAVAGGSPGVVVGAAKDVLTVKAKAAPMTPALIRCAPRAKAVACSTRRTDATVDVAMNGRATVARGVTAPMTLFLRRWEARADPIGSECPEILPSETLIPFGRCPSR